MLAAAGPAGDGATLERALSTPLLRPGQAFVSSKVNPDSIGS